MAFRFNWPEFDSEFYKEATLQLETALNKGNKPKNIVDHISVTELNMGTIAPDLEILEIGELSTDKFRGIFKLTYCGDAFIVIQTKVQANPMYAKESDLSRYTRPNVLAADQPLIVPMLLRISDLKLRGIIVLVVSKTKGITLVFKNDPLESILVSSTFDSVTSVRTFLQHEIENQLRNLFQEDLPIMIHNLSLKHIQSEQERAQRKDKDTLLLLLSNRARSVFSDPGFSRRQDYKSNCSSSASTVTTPPPRHKLLDLLSLPDLSSHHYFNETLNQPTFSELYFNAQQQQQQPFINTAGSSDFEPVSSYTPQDNDYIPLTAVNLSALNPLYSSNQYSDLKTATNENDDYNLHPSTDPSLSSHLQDTVYYDYYHSEDHDVDAPWYITEGPELPSPKDCHDSSSFTIPLDEKIILNPQENSVAAKLAKLATLHHSISPFTPTFQHFTFRSLPHTLKADSVHKMVKNSKKSQRRRIIRWNTTI
ncbi:uncharacterized protein BX663DRAFT_508460 [Cokeromyces recurvatus]|uniref:uncharacterized protein n=1 Tax=Cokeromyces recurvatus TaxID=90255 RepID=UPI0022203738|nr:uncharacterized protein BX663DRAFT_508460 [Cokeromyces recurvatus]KAI7903397.1 hypothetical protein BX663DRAFT_508460 [Cokeromyces recurvatus]